MDLRSMVPFGFGGSQLARRGAAEDPFSSFRREMDRVFDDFFTGRAPTRFVEGVDVRFDVSETENEIKVMAELPGVDEKDVDVTLTEDLLTIRGEKKRQEERKDENYHMVERSYGGFARSIRLPFGVDQDKVAASFNNGVLTVTLPKPPEVQRQARKIEIKKSA